MTIGGWILFAFLGLTVLGFGIFLGTVFYDGDKPVGLVIICIVTIGLIIGLFCGLKWYYSSTASGQRAMTDQKSELANGLERHITIYTADGKVLAEYEGQIDIEGNDGGYVLFDFEGKRYTYYNCFVESIAEIGG